METESSEKTYSVKTAGFEGPFGLLLHLVEKRKLFISDVSLAEVTDDYLNYIRNLDLFSPAEVSSFVLVAATLILLKSKSLLPGFNLNAEEENDTRMLEERLRLYEHFIALSRHVRSSFGKKIIFQTPGQKSERVIFLPDERIEAGNMLALAKALLHAMPKATVLPEAEIKKVITLEEMLSKLQGRIESAMKLSFSDFAPKARTREEKVVVIVAFLSMLELMRRGVLQAMQTGHFSDIIIEKRELVIESPASS